MIKHELHRSKVHNIAHYAYPIILYSGIVTLGGFWGLDTFPYVDGMNLVNNLVPSLALSVVLGLFIGILLDFRKIRVIK